MQADNFQTGKEAAKQPDVVAEEQSRAGWGATSTEQRSWKIKV